jgi:predicted transcriptional regulator
MRIKVEPDTRKVIEETKASALRAFKTGEYQGEVRGFSSLAQLFEVFTPKRWTLIETLQKVGPTSLRGLARALHRDVKRVHDDVRVLLEEGVIERDKDGKLIVPFVSVTFDATIRKAA